MTSPITGNMIIGKLGGVDGMRRRLKRVLIVSVECVDQKKKRKLALNSQVPFVAMS